MRTLPDHCVSLMRLHGYNDGEHFTLVRHPPFDEGHVVGKLSTANPQDGKCFCNATTFAEGSVFITHDSSEAGHNCFLEFDRPWNRFIIFSDIRVLEASWVTRIVDHFGPSTLTHTLKMASTIVAWRREDEWIGVGGRDRELFSKEYRWSNTEGGSRTNSQDWKGVSLGVSCLIEEQLDAGQTLMLRSLVKTYAFLAGSQYGVQSALNTSAQNYEMGFIGLE